MCLTPCYFFFLSRVPQGAEGSGRDHYRDSHQSLRRSGERGPLTGARAGGGQHRVHTEGGPAHNAHLAIRLEMGKHTHSPEHTHTQGTPKISVPVGFSPQVPTQCCWLSGREIRPLMASGTGTSCLFTRGEKILLEHGPSKSQIL